MTRDTDYRITPEKMVAAKRMRSQGMTYKAIAQQLQINWQTLYSRLNADRPALPNTGTEQRIIEMLELRKQGLRNDEIARELGVTHTCVKHTLSRKRLERYGFSYIPSPYFKVVVA